MALKPLVLGGTMMLSSGRTSLRLGSKIGAGVTERVQAAVVRVEARDGWRGRRRRRRRRAARSATPDARAPRRGASASSNHSNAAKITRTIERNATTEEPIGGEDADHQRGVGDRRGGRALSVARGRDRCPHCRGPRVARRTDGLTIQDLPPAADGHDLGRQRVERSGPTRSRRCCSTRVHRRGPTLMPDDVPSTSVQNRFALPKTCPPEWVPRDCPGRHAGQPPNGTGCSIADQAGAAASLNSRCSRARPSNPSCV